MRQKKLVERYELQLEKVDDIEALMESAQDRLEKLYQAMCKKYAVSPRRTPFEASCANGQVQQTTKAESIAPKEQEQDATTFVPPTSAAQAFESAIIKIYKEHNPSKLSSVSELLNKYTGQEAMLYRSICQKYSVAPDEMLLNDDAVKEEKSAAAVKEEPRAASEGSSQATSAGWGWGGGLSALQAISGAAEGLREAQKGLQGFREQVERSFEEAIRSEEDVSVLQAVKTLGAAASSARSDAEPSGKIQAFQSLVDTMPEQVDPPREASIHFDGTSPVQVVLPLKSEEAGTGNESPQVQESCESLKPMDRGSEESETIDKKLQVAHY